AAVIAGVVPALQSIGRRMQVSLKEFGSRSGPGLGRTWTTMIVAQVALAVAALPMAIAGFWGDITGASTSTSFETRPYLAAMIATDSEPPMGVDADAYRRDVAARAARLQTELVARIKSEPQVDIITLARGMPGDEPLALIEVDGVAAPLAGPPRVAFNHVASDFFQAFDATLIAGRLLTDADVNSAARPVVVSQSFARRVLGDRAAIGARVRYIRSREEGLAFGDGPAGDPEIAGLDTEQWHEVVGVVGDLFTNPIDPERIRPAMFHALDASAARPAMLIRVRGSDAAAFAPRLREIAMSLDPAARVGVRTFVQMQRQQQLALRLLVLALSLITAAVLLLSAAGIYALMSFTVSRRRKEIGIRAAMGADASQLLRGIFSRSAAQLGAGVAAGVAIALLADASSGGEALGSAGRWVFVPMIAALMIVAGLTASIGPARRGLRVQPTEALRAE
ncbi:MAG TPA: FtsX-like permease family protein, partial [Vicinamibacterales bacterium]